MNVRELRQQAKARKIPKYYRMGKARLLSALGLSAEAKAHKSQATRRKAIAFNATKEGGDSSVKKAQVKGRILRSIKRAMTAKEKSLGRTLTQQEKRAIAARALASEVKAIRSGTPESKPKRGNAQNLKPAAKSSATKITIDTIHKVVDSKKVVKQRKAMEIRRVDSGSFAVQAGKVEIEMSHGWGPIKPEYSLWWQSVPEETRKAIFSAAKSIWGNGNTTQIEATLPTLTVSSDHKQSKSKKPPTLKKGANLNPEWAGYQQGMNEGGDGYNPRPKYIKA